MPKLFLLSVLIITAARADEPSKDVREKMAKLHVEMAECLRSETPVEQCRERMRAACRQVPALPCGLGGRRGGRGRGRP